LKLGLGGIALINFHKSKKFNGNMGLTEGLIDAVNIRVGEAFINKYFVIW